MDRSTSKSRRGDLKANRSDVIVAVLTGISVLLFLVSLTQDGFYIDRADNPRAWSLCFGLLLLGWIVALDGVWAWFANPLLLVTWLILVFSKQRLMAACFGGVSLGLSLSFLLTQQILSDEAGNHSQITGYGAGYWLWIASISAAVLGSLLGMLIAALEPKRDSDSGPSSSSMSSGGKVRGSGGSPVTGISFD